MKKIHLLVIKAFIRPFIVTFFIVMFVLLMLWLFKYIDDLIGKVFEWYTIAQLLWYASATNVAMALPLAMLLSSIMTFGSLGENYELVAIKSAGISLQKAMMPLVILVAMLSLGAFLFSDFMLPKINLKMGTLLFNARSQKPSFLIKEGVFNDSFPGYTLRVNKKDDDKETLHGIMIYDHTNPGGTASTLLAKRGKMYVTNDQKYLVFKLIDGVQYEEKTGERTGTPRQILMRTRFGQTEKKFDLGVFNFQKMPEDAFKTNYIMLNIAQLTHYRDSVSRQLGADKKVFYQKLTALYSFYSGNGKYVKKTTKPSEKKKYNSGLELVRKDFRESVLQSAISEASQVTA